MSQSAIKPICLQLVLLTALAIGGCAESYWKVPYPPCERVSILWSRDARTKGWNGVEVEYALLGAGGVNAIVRSPDGHQQFTAHGRCWYEDARGNHFKSYRDGLLWVVEFNGREEHYRFVHHPRVDRGCISVVEQCTTSATEN
jgi:hypothetical protein